MFDFVSSPTLTEEQLPNADAFDAFYPFIKGVFSQWHVTPFNLDGRTFATAEQWMMFCKAMLFRDHERAEQILATEDPSMQKRLGSLVSPFDQATWDRWKIEVVYNGNKAKFSQNPGAARQLLQTAPAMLVEANVRDWIWGVGLSLDDPKTKQPNEWRGTNLLGRILTKVRSELDC
ncbi:NADAR family protein [Qipengyuania sp. 6B39]|uniref:NADAR family protein n=1 Tax=Qipengyuania proteolytica TaxID=2867239 RepID=UPI001C89E31E|nr:NADAR family protein [Qipengyuania proteolytica]MBX7495428.1 NADAR family protein [Qipengyuania proteolytica]